MTWSTSTRRSTATRSCWSTIRSAARTSGSTSCRGRCCARSTAGAGRRTSRRCSASSSRSRSRRAPPSASSPVRASSGCSRSCRTTTPRSAHARRCRRRCAGQGSGCRRAATRPGRRARPATGYLADVLDLNPGNARARQLFDLIQTAYLRAVGRQTEFPTWVLFNPSKLLTWLSRTIGGFLFSAKGVLAILLFIAVGVYAYTQISFDHIRFGAFDIALAILVFQTQALVHELSHGLACQHYGGNVTEVGFTLLYGVQPAQYCDTSSSYRITDRRHKLVVQMAGTLGSFTFMAAIAMMLALVRPTLPVYSACALAVLI